MRNAFLTYHPAVPFGFFICALVCTMVLLHPVCVVVAFLCALECSFLMRGIAKTGRSFAWIVPLWLIAAVVNGFYSSSGSTPVFTFGPYTLHLEALVYGACAGGMLVSMILLLSAYSSIMRSEQVMGLFGNLAPQVSLIVSQVLRLVPQFLQRGRTVLSLHDATTANVLSMSDFQRTSRLRTMSVLMGWGMEDSIDRIAAMRARGYESGMKRTSYKRLRFEQADAVALIAILGLGCAAFVCALICLNSFSFYPEMTELGFRWEYVPQIVFAALPLFLQAGEEARWRSSK